jgi:hypothetical protein
VQLRGVGGDPFIVVGNGEGGEAHVGTDLYFDNLKERFGNIGVFCMSLLRGEGEEANVRCERFRDIKTVTFTKFDPFFMCSTHFGMPPRRRAST